jgi:hypothetical protein
MKKETPITLLYGAGVSTKFQHNFNEVVWLWWENTNSRTGFHPSSADLSR